MLQTGRFTLSVFVSHRRILNISHTYNFGGFCVTVVTLHVLASGVRGEFLADQDGVFHASVSQGRDGGRRAFL